MKIFFIGWHQPVNGKSGCQDFPYAMISINRLLGRKSKFPVQSWLLDSGAFSRITSKKGHLSVKKYAQEIYKWQQNGNLMAAVTQDYMCEKFVLETTGLTVKIHQKLTIHRYDRLLSELKKFPDSPYIMPVLQGYSPSEYLDHLKAYGDRLKPEMWVGVGSVCKRNGKPGQVAQVLLAIKTARPDLRLHGFGIKKKSLEDPIVWDLLYSADSQAATLANGKGSNKYVGGNNPLTALNYAKQIKRPLQLSIFS